MVYSLMYMPLLFYLNHLQAKAKGEQDGHHLAQIGSVSVAFSWASLWYLSYTSLLSFRVSFVVSLWAKTKRKPCRNDLS